MSEPLTEARLAELRAKAQAVDARESNIGEMYDLLGADDVLALLAAAEENARLRGEVESLRTQVNTWSVRAEAHRIATAAAEQRITALEAERDALLSDLAVSRAEAKQLEKAIEVCVPSIIRCYMQVAPNDNPDIVQKVLDRVNKAMADYHAPRGTGPDTTTKQGEVQ